MVAKDDGNNCRLFSLRILDKKNGIGLIERVRVGLGKPNIIYVKDFLSMLQEKSVVQKFKDLTSEVKNIAFHQHFFE
ncbi:hypothetical protein HMPREF1145_0727 [Oribacterium parvum ACB8]|nr:hypothetical protein HMPREF1145_0727 [Oribacterium parvum ACB8]